LSTGMGDKQLCNDAGKTLLKGKSSSRLFGRARELGFPL
jgi:hypothetical protein